MKERIEDQGFMGTSREAGDEQEDLEDENPADLGTEDDDYDLDMDEDYVDEDDDDLDEDEDDEP